MSVIRRLPRYYRFLCELDERKVERISSNKLAKIMHSTASQVRQDLNCFGGFGQQGYGYSVKGLKEEIKKILGLNNKRKLTISVTPARLRKFSFSAIFALKTRLKLLSCVFPRKMLRIFLTNSTALA